MPKKKPPAPVRPAPTADVVRRIGELLAGCDHQDIVNAFDTVAAAVDGPLGEVLRALHIVWMREAAEQRIALQDDLAASQASAKKAGRKRDPNIRADALVDGILALACQGFKLNSIAVRLGVPESTIRSRLKLHSLSFGDVKKLAKEIGLSRRVRLKVRAKN